MLRSLYPQRQWQSAPSPKKALGTGEDSELQLTSKKKCRLNSKDSLLFSFTNDLAKLLLPVFKIFNVLHILFFESLYIDLKSRAKHTCQ